MASDLFIRSRLLTLQLVGGFNRTVCTQLDSESPVVLSPQSIFTARSSSHFKHNAPVHVPATSLNAGERCLMWLYRTQASLINLFSLWSHCGTFFQVMHLLARQQTAHIQLILPDSPLLLPSPLAFPHFIIFFCANLEVDSWLRTCFI